MLPLLIAAGAGMAGLNYWDQYQRESGGAAFREGLGSAGQLESRGEDIFGSPIEGPLQVQGQRGLLGAVSDPVQRAYLEMLGKMAGQPGVSPGMLMQGAQRVTELGAQSSENEAQRSFLADQGINERLFRSNERQAAENFQTVHQMSDQDFRAWEKELDRQQQIDIKQGDYEQAWKLERYRQSMENARASNRRELQPGKMYYGGPPIGPGGQQVAIIGPTSGTDDYVKGITGAREARDSVANIDKLSESYLLRGRGMEGFGPDAGEQAARYNRMVLDIGKNFLGTLQKGDLEFLEKFLPDPGSFITRWTNNDPRINRIMETVREAAARKYAVQREANPWIVGVGGDIGHDLPPMPTEASVAAKYDKRAPADVTRRLVPQRSVRGRIIESGELRALPR